MDGIASVGVTYFATAAHLSKKTHNHVYEVSGKPSVTLTELDFTVDDYIIEGIAKARAEVEAKVKELYCKLMVFDRFGKDRMKEIQIHPDTFVQIALQTAIYKTHQRFVRHKLYMTFFTV